MPLRITEDYIFGGVDSRSNPANMPQSRALRCMNFEPQPGGWLQLRRGFTNPLMSTVDTSSGAIHSGIYFESLFSSYSAGPLAPGIAVDNGGTNAWANPSNIKVADGNYASVTCTNVTPSNLLYAYNFSFTIPSNVLITKVQVDVKGFQTIGWSGKKQSYIYAFLTPDGITQYPVGSGSYTMLPVGVNTFQEDIGITPLWGESSITPAVVNANSFGVLLGAGTAGSSTIFNLDFVCITIYGNSPSGPVRYVAFGQSQKIKIMNVATGAIAAPQTIANDKTVRPLMGGGPWGFFVASGKLFFNDGQGAMQSYDGNFQRAAGIRAPADQPLFIEVSGVTVTDYTGSTTGSMSTTSLGGYQLFMAYENQNTGQVGNRVAIGTPINITNTTDFIVVQGLPDLTNIYAQASSPEWNIVIGRTNDGGLVPYWFTDANGLRIHVAPGATVATFTQDTVDFNSELPINNDVPPSGMRMFTNVLNTIFGATGEDYFIYASNNIALATAGGYVGRPEESWPATNAESFPTAEVLTCLANYNFQGWFFSRNSLAQFSQSLVQASSDPWLGPWAMGCAGPRAFVSTPYGPFWVTGDRQIATYGYWGPMAVSEEYERALLAGISCKNLILTELAYIRDPTKNIDRLEVLGFDSNNAPVWVVHDFKLREQTNLFMSPGEGQGYTRQYPTTVFSTFVRNATEKTLMKDAGFVSRLWAGDNMGYLRQLEDGDYDGYSNTTFSADYIGLIPQGAKEPRVAGLSWFGDGNLAVSYAVKATAQLTDFVATTTKVLKDTQNLYEAPIGDQGSFLYMRLQLDSHPADGNTNLTDPPNIPMNPYGVVLGVRLKQGAVREEVRR